MSPQQALAPPDTEFRFAAGFEGADHRNSRGVDTAMLDASGHARSFAEDYARLRALGVRSVRESIGWRRSERNGRFDFSCALRRADAARRAGIEVLWTFMHYGIPDDVGVDDEAFAARFAQFALAAAQALFEGEDAIAPWVTPVNEISFMAWSIAATSLIYPYRGDRGDHDGDAAARGFEVKRRLVRAAIAGADAIREVVPGARVLAIDPLVHIVPTSGEPAGAARAAEVRAYQYQAYDMLCGRLEAGLGGGARYLDAIGVNYYHSNQFEVDTERRLHWHLRDPRRLPLSTLLAEAHVRYGVPVMIAETSHFGVSRGRWLAEIATEARIARRAGVPVTGLCVYPAADRPDWENASHWHRSGLWDRELAPDGTPYAQWNLPSMIALREAARDLAPARAWPSGEFCLVVFAARGGGSAAHARALLLREHERCSSVLVVEPVRTSAHAPVAAIEHAGEGFHVLAPILPEDQSDEARTASLGGMVLEAIDAIGASHCVAWLETPMARPLLGLLMAERVVYAPETGADRIDAGANGSVGAGNEQRAHALHHRALLGSPTVRQGASETAQRSARTGPHPLVPGTAGVPVDVDFLVIGGGAAGIAAALEAGPGALLIEREATLGGSRRSATDHGFVFDAVPHRIDVAVDEAALFAVDALEGNVAANADDTWVAQALQGPPARALAPVLSSPALRPRGGIQTLIDALGARIRCPVWRNARVDGIDVFMRCAWLDDGRVVRYRRLLATPALPSLLALLRGTKPPGTSPPSLFAHALRCVHLGVRAARPAALWRIDGPQRFDRFVVRSRDIGGSDPCRAISCELPYSTQAPLPASGSRLISLCTERLVAANVIASADDVVVAHETDCSQACVEAAPGDVDVIETWLGRHGIGFVGSRGAWEPGHWRAAFSAGTRAAQAARASLAPAGIAAHRR